MTMKILPNWSLLYLAKECFDTMMVHDGERALIAFDTYKPNLVLLDLMLPGIDGYQVCREIRTRSNTPNHHALS